jgi:hypothetical protein
LEPSWSRISFQKIEITVFRRRFKVTHVGKQGVAGLLSAEPVQDAVGQDALEKHRQLGDGLVAVVFRQLHHAVLDDVQRRFVVATWYSARLKARFSTLFRKSDSSCSVAKGRARKMGNVSQAVFQASGQRRNYGTRSTRPLQDVLQCDNALCKSKGKRTLIRRCKQPAHGLGSKSRHGSTRVREGAPKVFRQRNSQRLIMEISKAELSAAAASAHSSVSELRGAEVLVKSLQAENVKYIWGYPGGAVLHIYDAFYKQDTIQHILVRHEQAAVHAADGYARATGDVGVALVTSGPGVTNAVTGIATAYMDSIPMVIITGQVPTAAIGLDAFQECDTVGITRPIVKHNFLVKDARHMAEVMKKAFHIARSGRPGPVVVDIPKDVSFNKVPWTGYPATVEMRSYNPVRKGHGGQIRKALQLLMTAKRPTSTRAEASCWAMPLQSCARWWTCLVIRAPTP